jgi:metallo-beta-lactamase family protein
MNTEKKKLKLTFVTGVTTVTGANFLLETLPEYSNEQVKILIDCGIEQGGGEAEKNNHKAFSYDPSTINYLLVTHAHADHIGRIPKLVKDGFKGKIFSTLETKKIAPLMFEDALKLFSHEEERTGLPALYTVHDVEEAMKLWHDIPYHQITELHGGFQVYPKDAGHILGSAMYEITYHGTKIVFTGDLGNSPTPLLKDTEDITDATYMVMESVYGDRNHETGEERTQKLEDVIEDTCKKGGALIIPSFSLEKTQVLLYELNKMIEEGRIPPVPVYLDSPLAIKITSVYKEFKKDFNSEVQDRMMKGDDIFNFPRFTIVQTSEDSKKLLFVPNPKIIIAGSGMSNGGRVIHHEINYLPDPKSTLLLVGYQSLGTLGRHIQNGEKKVTILGKEIPVRARIAYIDGYSSHKDADHLLEFVSQGKETLKCVFPVMGEPKTSLFLAQRIQDYLGVKAYHPKDGESIELDF